MIKKTVVFITFLILLISVQAFAQMRELTLSEKIANATAIFEGKVIRKTSSWNAEHTLIYTFNTIEVYKIFKGNPSTLEIGIITEGGQVGDEIQEATSSLDLKEGDIGIFMVELVSHAEKNGAVLKFFRVYGGPQGFIKYDLLEKTASDPFKKYTSIQNDVYKAITDKTGQSYKVIKPFNIDESKDTTTKKRKCRFKCCRKKQQTSANVDKGF